MTLTVSHDDMLECQRTEGVLMGVVDNHNEKVKPASCVIGRGHVRGLKDLVGGNWEKAGKPWLQSQGLLNLGSIRRCGPPATWPAYEISQGGMSEGGRSCGRVRGGGKWKWPIPASTSMSNLAAGSATLNPALEMSTGPVSMQERGYAVKGGSHVCIVPSWQFSIQFVCFQVKPTAPLL
jgi:hypothetical protein